MWHNQTHHHNRASVVSRNNFNNVDRGSQNTVPQANKNSVGKDGMIGRLLTKAFSICTSSDKSWRSENFTVKWNYAIFSSPQNDKTLAIRINSKRGQLGKVVSHADCKWDVWRLTRAGDGVNTTSKNRPTSDFSDFCLYALLNLIDQYRAKCLNLLR